MLKVLKLSTELSQELEQIHKTHKSYSPRVRAHAILLSDSGLKVAEIATIYGVCRQTVAIWLNDWDANGISGLFHKPRSGRPTILSAEEEADFIVMVNNSPRSIKKVASELKDKLGFCPSISTLKRLVKKRFNLEKS